MAIEKLQRKDTVPAPGKYELDTLPLNRTAEEVMVTMGITMLAPVSPKLKLINSCQGKILDKETGSPIYYATIQLKGTTIATVSDEDGNFKISVPASTKAIFVVSAVGYDSRKVTVTIKGTKRLRLLLEANSDILTGDVVIIRD